MANGVIFNGRVENRGIDNPAAWLEYAEEYYPHDPGFWANERNLLIRIANTKAGLGGLDTDTTPEEEALAAIRAFKA